MTRRDFMFFNHWRKPQPTNPLKRMTHKQRVKHFISLGSDKWRAEQLARDYK